MCKESQKRIAQLAKCKKKTSWKEQFKLQSLQVYGSNLKLVKVTETLNKDAVATFVERFRPKKRFQTLSSAKCTDSSSPAPSAGVSLVKQVKAVVKAAVDKKKASDDKAKKGGVQLVKQVKDMVKAQVDKKKASDAEKKKKLESLKKQLKQASKKMQVKEMTRLAKEIAKLAASK